MGRRRASGQNRSMDMENEVPTQFDRNARPPARIIDLEQELDAREETISELNEALRVVLDELAAMPEAA